MNELRALVREYLADRMPDVGWRGFGGELGMAGLSVPEEYGGAGQGFAEVAVVLEELGRSLVPVPFFGTVVLGVSALLTCSEEARRAYLPPIAAGELTATLATGFSLTDGRLSGRADAVIDGHTAGLLIAAVPGHGLFGVEDASDAPGPRTDETLAVSVEGASDALGLRADETLAVSALPVMDDSRPLASVVLDGVEARPLGGSVEGVLDLAAAGLAAEMTGGARRVLEMSVEYAKLREQFGRPIGAYQAIKHRCAEMLIDVEAATAAVAHAVEAAGTPAFPAAASLAKAYCGDAYVRAATECIQIHGGIGFTWEHPAHRYYKRAHASRLLFGTSDHHRDLLAATLTDGE